MMLRNNVSRCHVIAAAIEGAAKHNPQVALDMTSSVGGVKYQVFEGAGVHHATGRDPDGPFDNPEFGGTVIEGGEKKKGAKGSQEDDFFVN